MNVYKLTEQQAQQIEGQTYDGEQLMVPPTDADGNRYISQEVYNRITLVRANELGVISWWFTLPLIPYNPVIPNFPI
jgi:hypothetical protein